MASRQHSYGFVLPIVVLLIGVLGLVWGLRANPSGGSTVNERQFKEQQALQAELLFWHKALVAFAFTQDRGISSFNELLYFYQLEKPEYRLANGDVVTFSNIPSFENIVELRISNLPEAVVQSYLNNYPNGVQADRAGGLIFPAVAIDSWVFAQNLIRRNPVARAELYTDLDLAGRSIQGVSSLLTTQSVGNSGHFATNNRLAAATASQTEVQKLKLVDATLAGHNLRELVDAILALETQMAPCLMAGGSCFN